MRPAASSRASIPCPSRPKRSRFRCSRPCRTRRASGGTKPASGWPVVIFQHGLTRNRMDAVGIADTFRGRRDSSSSPSTCRCTESADRRGRDQSVLRRGERAHVQPRPRQQLIARSGAGRHDRSLRHALRATCRLRSSRATTCARARWICSRSRARSATLDLDGDAPAATSTRHAFISSVTRSAASSAASISARPARPK